MSYCVNVKNFDIKTFIILNYSFSYFFSFIEISETTLEILPFSLIENSETSRESVSVEILPFSYIEISKATRESVSIEILPFSYIEISETTRESVSVETLGVHLRSPLKYMDI